MSYRATVLLIALIPVATLAQQSTSLTPQVRVETTQGSFVLELDTVRAPLTSENFLRYVRDGYYDGTVFHRVIPNFVVQAGGFDASLMPRQGRAAIPNESGNGLSNRRGTIGLAREESPHSGSSQFYINLMDNAGLDPLPSRWGYTVFGRVIEGMDVVDRIAHLPTRTVTLIGPDVPVEAVVIQRAFVVETATSAEPRTEPAPAPTPPGPETSR